VRLNDSLAGVASSLQDIIQDSQDARSVREGLDLIKGRLAQFQVIIHCDSDAHLTRLDVNATPINATPLSLERSKVLRDENGDIREVVKWTESATPLAPLNMLSVHFDKPS